MCYRYSQYDLYNVILSPKVFLYVFQTYKLMKAKSFKMSYQTNTIIHILSFCQVLFNGKIPTLFSIMPTPGKREELQRHGKPVMVLQLWKAISSFFNSGFHTAWFLIPLRQWERRCNWWIFIVLDNDEFPHMLNQITNTSKQLPLKGWY